MNWGQRRPKTDNTATKRVLCPLFLQLFQSTLLLTQQFTRCHFCNADLFRALKLVPLDTAKGVIDIQINQILSKHRPPPLDVMQRKD